MLIEYPFQAYGRASFDPADGKWTITYDSELSFDDCCLKIYDDGGDLAVELYNTSSRDNVFKAIDEAVGEGYFTEEQAQQAKDAFKETERQFEETDVFFPGPDDVGATQIENYTAHRRAQRRDYLIKRITEGDLSCLPALRKQFGEEIRLSVEVVPAKS